MHKEHVRFLSNLSNSSTYSTTTPMIAIYLSILIFTLHILSAVYLSAVSFYVVYHSYHSLNDFDIMEYILIN